MKEYEVPLPWYERLLESKFKFKNDSSSKDSYICRYGEEIGVKLWDKKTKACGLNKEKFIQKHGEEAYKVLQRKKIINNLEVLIERFGKEEAYRRKEAYLEKWKKSISIKKAKQDWRATNTVESYARRHGEEEGYRRWDERRKRFSFERSAEGYKQKFGDGWEIEWEKRKQYFVEISKKAKQNISAMSKISQNLFWKILEQSKIDKNECKFGELNEEQRFDFPLNEHQKHGLYYFKVDFLYKNKIIEFDGKYWHSRPEIIKKDKIKTDYLLALNYKVLRVKEKEYKEAPLKTIKKCLEFLLET